ncbi:MAG: c-type cytochrome [Steroidobacteraceae bacterium]
MVALHAGRRYARLAASLLLVATLACAATTTDSVTAGRRIYLEGLGLDGAPVSATVHGDVSATGLMLACVGCHKRSGLGSFEAGLRALPVTGPQLFEPAAQYQAKVGRPRTLYTDETLSRAITQGISSDGRILDPLMPRFRLTAQDLRALTAYLRTLGSQPDPGVSGTELELVTIVSANAAAREREAVIAVVRRFADIKNSGTRQEERRAAASRQHVYGEKHVRAHRQWNLSIWTLEGAAAGWPAQLEKLYRERPPFAVISGATGQDWPVVHDFCESHELPCILPVTDLPVETGAGHYTIYYSAGVRLDARITAQSVAGYDDPEGTLLVTYVDDARGRAALQAFTAELPGQRRANLATLPIAPESKPTYKDWQDVIHRERPDLLVAWLNPAQLGTLTSIASSAATLPRRIYTAASFTDWQSIRALPMFEQRVFHVYPYTLATPGLAQFPREEAWLNQQKLADLDRIPAAEALFACHAIGEAMAVMADNYSREYLIETLEHMLDGSRMTTMYPLTTLGTGQRFLAKGAHVLRLVPDTGASRYVSAGWIQP